MASPGPSESSNVEDLARHLAQAKKAGHGMRLKISGTAGTAGCLLALVSLGLQVSSVPGSVLGYAGAMLGAPALLCILLAVLPTDKKLITWAGRVLALFATLAALFALSIAAARISEPVDCEEEYDAEQFYCDWNIAWWLLTGCTGLACCVVVTLGQRLPPRANLANMWFAAATTFIALGVIRLLDYAIGVPAGYYSDISAVRWVGSICLTLTWLGVGALCLHPGTRIKVHAALSARGEQVATAAAIAAMMGGNSSSFVQSEGRKKFKCVTLDKVSEAEMAASTPDPALADRAEPAHLGDVDAFISHSWSDPVRSKWVALQAWRNEFKAKHQREPRVWIDKFCIDQKDIDANLMCLPVFLSGCKTILLMVGTTYLSRLWCILEIFVFFEMGADVDRVELKLISEKSGALGGGGEGNSANQNDADFVHAERRALVNLFGSFNANQARCFDMVQRERLLAIVEAGFGGVDLFNQALRNILSRIQSTNDEEREGLQLFFADSAIPDFLSSPTTRESFVARLSTKGVASWRPSARKSASASSSVADARSEAFQAEALAAAADLREELAATAEWEEKGGGGEEDEEEEAAPATDEKNAL